MQNWAGNVVFGAARIHRPSTRDELRRVVTGAAKVRVLGSGHSFNRIADTPEDLVNLAGLPAEADIDSGASTIRVSGGLRYGDIAELLHRSGYALPNLASLPHISIAGAVATGTHGSGVRNGNLATSVRSVELLTADGDELVLERSDAGFPGVVVSLGALGVVTAITLDLQQTYDVRQHVYEELPFEAPLAEVLADGYSVSLFTDFVAPRFTQVWRKARGSTTAPELLFGARAATKKQHPIAGADASACTEQFGVPGPWHERLPHFRLGYTPSSGDELQSEYFVPLTAGADALAALAPLAPRIAPILLVCEIRGIAADGQWLSPCSGRDSIAFHFTWRPLAGQVRAVLPDIEAALDDFDVRPHWGKVFTLPPSTVKAAYPHMEMFRSLAADLDPTGKFRNEFVDTYLGS
jgi:alditol oxidase